MNLSPQIHRMDPDDVIIEDRDAMSWRHHLRDTVVTVLLWLFLAWLWQPAFVVFVWYLDLALVFDDREVLEGLANLEDLTWFYISAIAVICGTLLTWARVQQWRARRRQASPQPPGLDNAQIADWFGVDAETRRHWTRLRNANVYFDAENMLVTLRLRDIEDNEDDSFDELYTSPIAALQIVPESQDQYMDYRPANPSPGHAPEAGPNRTGPEPGPDHTDPGP